MSFYSRVYGVLLSIVLLTGFGFIAVTPGMLQVDPTDQQATVDAAVEQLFTATEQAKITQTVDAAFKQALTGTAAALATPIPTATPTQEPFEVDNVTIVHDTVLDMLAGPAGTGAYLAPNGEIFAYLDDDEICIYTIEGEERDCIGFDPEFRGLDTESIRWSPDSRYLVLTSDFFRFFAEPDLYVIDVEAGKMTNVTDDGVLKFSIATQDDFTGWIDVAPRWYGEYVYFIRYTQTNGVYSLPMLWRVKADGTGSEKVGTLPSLTRWSVYAFAISPDGSKVAYNYYAASSSDQANNGVWISDLNGSNAKQLVSMTLQMVPWTLEFSPDGRYLLSIAGNPGLEFNPEDSPIRVISLEDNAFLTIDDSQYVTAAGWSPTGSALVYTVRDPRDADVTGLYLTDEPGKPGKVIYPETLLPATSRVTHAIPWAANNVLLLSNMQEGEVVILEAGEE